MAIQTAPSNNICLTYSDVKNNGKLVENPDGSVSVYIGKTPFIFNKTCCEYLGRSVAKEELNVNAESNPNARTIQTTTISNVESKYFFDINTQKCMWSKDVCSEPLKLSLNTLNNGGSTFYYEKGSECSLSIDFDYLFKIKCETLSDILFPNSSVKSNPNEFKILTLQNQITIQTGKCEAIQNEINNLLKERENTPYSITCNNSIPNVTTTTMTNETKQAFTKTGFSTKTKSVGGGLMPFSFATFETMKNYTAVGTYCLTEDGLLAWEEILGSDNYQNFLKGDPTTYNCSNVQQIVDNNTKIVQNNNKNNTQEKILLYECNVPFGTRTALENDLAKKYQDKITCEAELNKLNTQLTELKNQPIPEPTITTSRCKTPKDVFETFDVSVTLDIVTPTGLKTIYEFPLFPAIGGGNLYNYLSTTTDSGFYVCGDPTANEVTFSACTPLTLNIGETVEPNLYECSGVMDSLALDLYKESGLSGITNGFTTFKDSLSPNSFASNWLHYNTTITDPVILNAIKNKQIKLSIKINDSCSDFCVLLDDISLNKDCESIDKTEILLTKSPGFELERIRDNKKSWISNTTPVNRVFDISDNNGNNSIRQTNYDVNDERLVINSKEIDLDINIASAIETDVWCYLKDNPCILTGETTCNPCVTGCCGDNKIDFQSLMTQPLSAVTTVEDFGYYLVTELTDAKNRQTISGYPTLRALYDRYMNSLEFCGTDSSKFTYYTIDQFASLLDNYWSDLIEQVVPATTIWGSVKVYTNTIFDQQKFKYRAYTTFLSENCGNPFFGEKVLSPINGTSGQCQSVEIKYEFLNTDKNNTDLTKSNVNKVSTCTQACLAQYNVGSEFIGTVSSETIRKNNNNGGAATNNFITNAQYTN